MRNINKLLAMSLHTILAIACAVILLLFLAGCDGAIPRPDTPPTLTPELTKMPSVIECKYLTDFPVVSENPCLLPPERRPYEHDETLNVIQVVPDNWDGWQNTLVNADGVRDKYSGIAPVVYADVGLKLTPHNNEHAINGQWALYQLVELEADTCYSPKLVLAGGINDPIHSHAGDYGMSLWIDDVKLAGNVYARQDLTEFIAPFTVGQSGEYRIAFSIDQLWPVAGHNSELNIRAAGVMQMPDSYCGND
jgi:hypothetical protein